jgi:hypothetical protein
MNTRIHVSLHLQLKRAGNRASLFLSPVVCHVPLWPGRPGSSWPLPAAGSVVHLLASRRGGADVPGNAGPSAGATPSPPLRINDIKRLGAGARPASEIDLGAEKFEFKRLLRISRYPSDPSALS